MSSCEIKINTEKNTIQIDGNFTIDDFEEVAQKILKIQEDLYWKLENDFEVKSKVEEVL